MEEEEVCAVCGVTGRQANLVNALLDNESEIFRVCETCAVVERAVVIPKPTKKQLTETEVPYTVYERLVRMSGVKPRQERSNVNLNALANKKIEKKPAKEIEIVEGSAGKSATIDFTSKNIKIGDLQKIKSKFSGEKSL
jgi:hypothetical protein